MPPGDFTSTLSPTSFPIKALAKGDFTFNLLFSMFASGSPTIWYTFSSSESSSMMLTVAENFIPPESFLGSITSAKLIIPSSSFILPSTNDCFSLAA